MVQAIIREIQAHANKEKVGFLARYFKTGKGEYGEGDIFWGLTVPQVRAVARKFYKEVSFDDIRKLISRPIHEYRQAALMMLALKFLKAEDAERKKIYDFYLRHTKFINNWDLIDGSAPIIVGGYLLDHTKERKILYNLAKSKSIWERRISILATFAFIKRNNFSDTLLIAQLLLNDHHDLMHKAVGWMLREVGKRDEKILEAFLAKHSSHMPRTTLRYAIERLSEDKRRHFLVKA